VFARILVRLTMNSATIRALLANRVIEDAIEGHMGSPHLHLQNKLDDIKKRKRERLTKAELELLSREDEHGFIHLHNKERDTAAPVAESLPVPPPMLPSDWHEGFATDRNFWTRSTSKRLKRKPEGTPLRGAFVVWTRLSTFAFPLALLTRSRVR
jgi:hypothetical protein